MKVGDEIILNGEVSKVTWKVYDQSLKKTVFYAGEAKLTGDEKSPEIDKEDIIVEKLEEVTQAIKEIPKVEIPEYPKFPEFPGFPEPKEFPAFPENMTVNIPDLSSIEKNLEEVVSNITALGNVKIDTGDIDLNTDGLETIGTATNTKLDTQIVNQETLISLIGTLQELNHRISFLAGLANAGAPALRTIPIASVSTAVTGTVTATVASTVVSSLTNFGTGIPASEMAHDINNQTAVLANINNASA